VATCPNCRSALKDGVKVCKSCLHVLDRDAWGQHDAGRLGADDRGGGKPLEDPPVGPVPLTVGGMEAGALGSAVRLGIAGKLLRWGRRR
jgi:hypothetical protein